MKPFQFVLFWLAFFISYFIFALIGYLIIPEGALLDVALHYKTDLTYESWDNLMGIIIFIGAAFVNAFFIWIMVWVYQRTKAAVGHALENK